MLPVLRSRFDELERQRRAVLDDLLALTPEQLRFHPAPGAWSLAQVIQHLVLVEEGTLQFLEKKSPRPPSARGMGDRIRWAIFSRVSPLPLRVKTPTNAVVPVADPPIEELVERWDDARRRMAAYLERIAERDLPLIVFKHVIGGALPILDTLAFLHLHIRHHLHQIGRIRAAPGWPAVPPVHASARAAV